MAGSFALIALAAAAATAEAADITVTDARIEAGKLVIAGTTAAPNMRVRLDGQGAEAFNVTSKANRKFRFDLVYLPSDCIVTLQRLKGRSALGAPTDAVVADCGRGLTPRGAWSAATPYLANDLVTHDGSTWLARDGNANQPPAGGADWQLFAKGAAGAEEEQGPAGPGRKAGTEAAARADTPIGPAGGDLAGAYPDPRIRKGAVTTNKIQNGAVLATKLGVGAVTTNKIFNGAVTTGKLANQAVTTAKIDNQAVTFTKIGPLAVITGKIADDAVTGPKIADGAVTSAHVVDDTIIDGGLAAVDLAANSVGSSEIATDAVGATEIQNDSIDSGEVVDFGLSNQDVGVLFAQVNANGTLASSSGSVTVVKLGGLGTYEVDFARNVSACAPVMTQGDAAAGSAGGAITGVTDRVDNVEAFFAQTRDAANVLVDRAFNLVVVC